MSTASSRPTPRCRWWGRSRRGRGRRWRAAPTRSSFRTSPRRTSGTSSWSGSAARWRSGRSCRGSPNRRTNFRAAARRGASTTSRSSPRCSRSGGEAVLPYQLVYHERYDLNLGEHVFPSKKFQWLKDRLLRTRFAAPEDFVSPEPATDDDVRLVHSDEWVAKLRSGTLSYQDILRLEIPYSRQMVEGFWLAAGGTILAARLALRDGVGFNIGGGFHHAFPGHGEGFCAVNDIG